MYTVIRGAFTWHKVPAQATPQWYVDEREALRTARAQCTGAPFLCAEGTLALTPVVLPDGTNGYLVEDLRLVASSHTSPL
jgi:hypothetical protein